MSATSPATTSTAAPSFYDRLSAQRTPLDHRPVALTATPEPAQTGSPATPATAPAASTEQPAALAPTPKQPAPMPVEGDSQRALSEQKAEDLSAEPLEALPEPPGDPELAGGPAPSAAEGRANGSLLEHPRFQLVQELFPGRLLSYNEPSRDESSLTDEGAAGRIDLDETDDSETEDEGEAI